MNYNINFYNNVLGHMKFQFLLLYSILLGDKFKMAKQGSLSKAKWVEYVEHFRGRKMVWI